MLDELIKELGVTQQQFLEACERAEQNPLHKKIVDQIVAVENFLAFKRLMVKRNQDLNKQAIELFNRMQNKEKAGDAKPDAPGQTKPVEEAKTTAAANPKAMSEEMREVMKVARAAELAEEEEMMKRALAESEKAAEEAKRMAESEEDMIRRAIEESQREEEERQKKIRSFEDE